MPSNFLPLSLVYNYTEADDLCPLTSSPSLWFIIIQRQIICALRGTSTNVHSAWWLVTDWLFVLIFTGQFTGLSTGRMLPQNIRHRLGYRKSALHTLPFTHCLQNALNAPNLAFVFISYQTGGLPGYKLSALSKHCHRLSAKFDHSFQWALLGQCQAHNFTNHHSRKLLIRHLCFLENTEQTDIKNQLLIDFWSTMSRSTS